MSESGPGESEKASSAATAVERAYLQIQDDILTGKLKGGQLLTETELEKSTGVSRTPIRDALKRLADEGLVNPDRSLRNRKNYVANLTPEYLEELTEMRAMLEAFVARRAATRIEPEDIERLEQIQDEIDRIIELKGHDSGSDFGRLNAEFHKIIWHAGSAHVGALLSGSLSAPFKLIPIPQDVLLEHLLRSSMYHREIIRALKRQDADSAGVHMHSHIKSVLPWIEVLKGAQEDRNNNAD